MADPQQHLDTAQSVHNHIPEVTVAALKVSPPVAISGWILAGHELEDWVLLATLIYTVLQILLAVHAFITGQRKEKSRGRKH